MVSFFELPESGPRPGGLPVSTQVPPTHCGASMTLFTPAQAGGAVAYTFAPEQDSEDLPPVWRCMCGFQLDIWTLESHSIDPAWGPIDSGNPWSRPVVQQQLGLRAG